jgi:hypothetical protein
MARHHDSIADVERTQRRERRKDNEEARCGRRLLRMKLMGRKADRFIMDIESRCLNCGQMGSHFAPPSFGEEGFFVCVRV